MLSDGSVDGRRVSRMRIAVGVKSATEARYYLENGAAEVYCGLVGMPNNRLPMENLQGVAHIRRVIALARRLKGRVFLALNDILPRAGYERTCGWIRSLTDAGLFGVILKDPAFMSFLKATDLRPYITLSTLSICFNSKGMMCVQCLCANLIMPIFYPKARHSFRVHKKMIVFQLKVSLQRCRFLSKRGIFEKNISIMSCNICLTAIQGASRRTPISCAIG